MRPAKTPRGNQPVRDGLGFGADGGEQAFADLGYRSAADAVADRSGRPVRDLPHRRTTEHDLGACRVFRKVRDRQPEDAQREWEALGSLAALGLNVPEPLFLAQAGARTALGMREVPGCSLLDLLPREPAWGSRFVVSRVAPAVRALHAAGLVHRDLYWDHWFAVGPCDPDGDAFLIDVERVFRPHAWLRRRYQVKDLAGLVASWPDSVRVRVVGLRFLRVYLGGGLPPGWKRLARAVLRKSRRIRAHMPVHGEPPRWFTTAAGETR
ncbi:MAG: hypothetical protein O2865_02560 [Planctomycetota bacterium]|nr:hypothetical protein [Planctomycetota bacterium]